MFKLVELEILALLPGYWLLLLNISVPSLFVFPLMTVNASLGLLFAKSVCILRNDNTQVHTCQTEN